MSLDFYKIKSLFLEDSVIRNPRVGSKNRPTSRTIDVGCTGINTIDNIYTGETGINEEYLVQGAVRGSIVKVGKGTFQNSKVTNIEDINGLLPGENFSWGDILRVEGEEDFYPITGASPDSKTIYFQSNTPLVGDKSFQVRKIKLDSTHFEYINNMEGESKFAYDENNREWRFTGIDDLSDPLVAKKTQEAYVANDPATFKFYPSNSANAPDVTSVDTTTTDPKNPYSQKILESKLASDTSDIILNPIPYPDDDENFHVYWGPQGNITSKRKNVDYTINYTMDPDYSSEKPPYKDRTVAYLKFLNELKRVKQVDDIGLGFQGVFNIHEDPSTSATKQARAVTNIFPSGEGLSVPGDSAEYNGEVISIGNKVFSKSFDYNIEYDNGIVNFIRHENMELGVPNVTYNQNLIWDGISVVKGVGLTGLKTADPDNLVIPYGIAGLTGIDTEVYFEDITGNDLYKDTDYTFEYQSGAIKLNTPLKSGECALVSYFSEGEDVSWEKLNLRTMQTRKYPIIEFSVTIKKKYSNTSTSETGIKILVEGVDFKVFYLTGKIVLLNQSILENAESLEISYTPFAQIQCILQPIADDPNQYRITILDDILKVIDPFNLKFGIKNKLISTKVTDPFGENPPTYDNSIIPKSVLSVKGKGEPGYGLQNISEDQMYNIGITGLHLMGLDKKLGLTVDEFYDKGITGVVWLGLEPDSTQIYDVTNYKYDDESKQLVLDTTAPNNVGKPRPDINDQILATYSYVGDVLPYAPVQTIFPIFNQDENSILVEGFDKTDTIYPGMIFRIDNFDPHNSYYFKIDSVNYDGSNTTINLSSSFPEEIRNPSFYLFDDIVNWHPLPSGISFDSTVTVGTDTLTLTGGSLKALDLLRPQTLMMLDNKDIYEVLTTTVIDGKTIQVKIFPNLQNEYPSNIKVSDPIYPEGSTDIISKYPIILDPPHPAFTVRYKKPDSAIFGIATIYIDGEKIILTEHVENSGKPFSVDNKYEFVFSNYGSIRDIANAIKNTSYTLKSGAQHYPFTLSNKLGVEQYYLGGGFWSSNLIIPFENDKPVPLTDEGYTITINHEVFKYILIKAYKDTPSFLVEQKDRRDYFSQGNLLAFRSKSSGSLTFYDVSGVELYQEKISDKVTLNHTKVSFKDNFRENMIAPYMYKYDGISWVEVLGAAVINHDASTISFSSDLTMFRNESFLKINDSSIYQIKSIIKDGTSYTLKVSPTISRSIRNVSSLKVSDMPVFLDAISPQPYLPISYSVKSGYSGSASVEITESIIKVTEKLDGFPKISREVSLTRYNNLNELAKKLSRLVFTIPGYNPLTINTEAYEDLFTAGGRSLVLVPTPYTALSANILVSKPVFTINYTAPNNDTSFRITTSLSEGAYKLKLSEWKTSDKQGTLVDNYIDYNGRAVSDIISSIESIRSITGPVNPWSVVDRNFDTYYGSTKPGYYSIVPLTGKDLDGLPYAVCATENPRFWYGVGILNRNVLVDGTDYNIEGTQVILTNPIKVSERYEVSYLGINNLAEYEGKDIDCSCRYFYSIPAGHQINVYMDYLNPDQYYIQKLTERKFLEIVTVPQVKELLQQAGGSVGMGNDSGSDNTPKNWDGGMVDLYYYLKDEKIKTYIYLKLFRWYKERLRNFAAEAQVIMGIKYGHSNYVGVKENKQFTLEDRYVEDNNYTLTKESDLAQIKNGFSKFFPVGYEGSAPQPYPRFKDEYVSYNEVFCYNIQFVDETRTPTKKEGRVVSINPYWKSYSVTGPYSDVPFSSLDYDILYTTQETSLISGAGATGAVEMYNVKYNQEEKHLRSTENNFKFLNRISENDQVQVLGNKSYYKVAKIERYSTTSPNVEQIKYYDKGVSGIPMTYDGDNVTPGIQNVYGVYFNGSTAFPNYVLGYAIGNETEGLKFAAGTPVVRDGVGGPIKGLGYTVVKPNPPFERLTLEDGKFFKESGVRTFTVRKSTANGPYYYYYYKKNAWGRKIRHKWTLDQLEENLPKDGMNLVVKRDASSTFPVSFPAWDDEFNLGVKVNGEKLIDQKNGSNVIRKSFSFSEFLGLDDDEDRMFITYTGSYDPLDSSFDISNTVKINLKYLNYFDERSVSRIVNSIKYNLTGSSYPIFPLSPIKVKVSKIHDRKNLLGNDRLFYVDFDKYYDENVKGGYAESIHFRTRNRNSWVQFGMPPEYQGGPDDSNPEDQPSAAGYDPDSVDPEYGFSVSEVFKNFYDPNNMFLKLLLEKQCWLTELNIIKDIFDVNNKLKRAFKLDVFGEEVNTSTISEFFSYLEQITGCNTDNASTLNIKMLLESYAEHLRFLTDDYSDSSPYLIGNKAGPLHRTLIEGRDTSIAIQKSYDQVAGTSGNPGAMERYRNFNAERSHYWNLNNFYYEKIRREYIKWVLSLEQGFKFQKDAKNEFQSLSVIDIGFKAFPAIKLNVVDQGESAVFSVSEAKYYVTYDMLSTSADDDAKLVIRYKISNITPTEVYKEFLLSNENCNTLRKLVNEINRECKHPRTGEQILRAESVFDYNLREDYSSKWILRNYRATSGNSSNGFDAIDNTGREVSVGSWTNIGSGDDRIHVSNVADRRNYDSRVFFMNREGIRRDLLNIDGSDYKVYPYYTSDQKILSEDGGMGLLPVSGSWSLIDSRDDGSIGYENNREVAVLSIAPGIEGDVIVSHEFIDYDPGVNEPRNPLYEKSPDELRALGYNTDLMILSEPEPPNMFYYLSNENALYDADARLKALTELSLSVEENVNKPVTEVIKNLRIVLRTTVNNVPVNAEFIFSLRQYPTLNDLNDALNNTRFTVDEQGHTNVAPEAEGAFYFSSELIGSEDVQGKIKTVDIAVQYEVQKIEVKAHLKYVRLDGYSTEADTVREREGLYAYYDQYTGRVEPYVESKYFSVGWTMRKQNIHTNNAWYSFLGRRDTVISSSITLGVSPKTYSLSTNYKFIPNNPLVARIDTFNKENKDILAFDIYSWDDNAAYKIKNNVLYLRSSNISEIQIPLYKGTDPDIYSSSLNLVDVIRLINTDGRCNKKFFANLRFGRQYELDFKFRYFPDTKLWFNSEWISIKKAKLDYLYLDKDTAFSISSEGSNATYEVTPYPSPYASDIVYSSPVGQLQISADVKAFNLTVNTSDYDIVPGTPKYSVDQSASEMTLEGSYQVIVDEQTSLEVASYLSIQDIADGINSEPFLTATVFPGMGSAPSTDLVDHTGPLPGRLAASFSEDPAPYVVNINLSTFSTIGALLSYINGITVPAIHGVPGSASKVFSATNAGVSNNTPSAYLKDVSGSTPAVLLATISSIDYNAINLNTAAAGPNHSITSASFVKSGNTLTLTYTVHYDYVNIPAIDIQINDPMYIGVDYVKAASSLVLNYKHIIITEVNKTVSLASNNTINLVIADINSFEPVSGMPFFNAVLKWIDGDDTSLGPPNGLKNATNVDIAIPSGTFVNMRGSQTLDLNEGANSRTIESIFNEINANTNRTGFRAIENADSYNWYKGLPANVFTPTNGPIPIGTPVESDFRLTPGALILNMSHTTSLNPDVSAGEICLCSNVGGSLKFVKNTSVGANLKYIGNSYSHENTSKNIKKLIYDSTNLDGYLEVENLNFSYAHGSLFMDVAILPVENIVYGKLRLRNKSETNPAKVSDALSIGLYTNDPETQGTHVYFGFLGDISFYQISDYNLWKQYILIKRRLGLPWTKVEDSYVPDNYVSNDSYKFSDYEYTLNLVQNGKFLSYLKNRRFKELADSLNLEDLYNNKYLWLFLKFDREVGCDQKVIALTKKINEDGQKAKLLS